MSLELIYTSVPRGLGPGSSGFCTAAATGGMSRQVVTRLEALSGYQFHFNLSDPRAAENPVNWAHTQVRIGAETLSVLSRIAYSGADYSGRTNKIAHHFLLEHGEQLANGPAWMMMEMAREVFVAGYGGEPRNLPKRDLRTLLPADARPPEPATTWQSQTGDAGWAGMLVKAFRENPKVPAFVIFAPGQELLPLFEESLALLPPDERWQVGFATYYTALPAGCQYHWRGIIAGSSAAKEIQRFPNATVIDLTTAVGGAPDNMFTQAARTGTVLPPVRAPERPRIQVAERAPQPVPLAVEVAREADGLAFAMESGQHGPQVDPREVPPSPSQLRSLIRRARRARWVPVFSAIAAVLVIALAGSVTLNIVQWKSSVDEPQRIDPKATAAAGTTQPPEKSQQAPSEPQKQPDAKPDDKKHPEPSAVASAGTAKESPNKNQGTSPAPGAAKLDEAVNSETKPGTGGGAERRAPEASKEPEPPEKHVPPAAEQEVRVEKNLPDREALIEEGYAPKPVQAQVANGGKTRKWNLGESSIYRFLDVPASIRSRRDKLLDLKLVPEGSTHRLDIEVPAAAGSIGGPKLLLSCRLKGEAKGRRLEAELGPGVTEQHYGDYLEWLVVEIADDNKHVYQCRLGTASTKKESKTLGYSNNGPLALGDPFYFRYPWRDLLTLRVGNEKWQPLQLSGNKSFEWPTLVSPDAGGSQERVIIKLEVDIVPRDAGKPGTKPGRGAGAAEKQDAPPQSELGIRARLVTMDSHINEFAKEVASQWKEYQEEVKGYKAVLDNQKSSQEEKNSAKKSLEKSRPPDAVQNAETNIKKFMDAAALALRQNGQVEVLDAWGVPVIQIELKFQGRKPEDLFKHFAPRDNQQK